MMRFVITLIMALLLSGLGKANNVRILGDIQWNPDELTDGNLLNLNFKIAWDNSWKDDYNWDAVYIVVKYKVGDAKDPAEAWHPVYFQAEGAKITGDYDFTFSRSYAPNFYKSDKIASPGVFIYRKYNGGGNASADVTLVWNISSNTSRPLTADNFSGDHKVQLAATAIEMVYVPTGVFKLGDSFSNKTFRKTYTPIPSEYDIVSSKFATFSSDGASGSHALAADRINDNEGTSSSWVSAKGANSWWRIDFGENNKKAIRFFGVNAAKSNPTYLPKKWKIYGHDDLTNRGNPLWEGGKEDWVIADDAYPIERAIKIPEINVAPHRYYTIYVDEMLAGTPIVKSIGMSDMSVDKLLDYSVLVDGETLKIDSLKGLGARDEEAWSGGTTSANYPNGYKGFYAMKYEMSQDQYVKFLNKLSRAQQEALLPAIKTLNVGDFIFGDSHKAPQNRNGIVIAEKPAGGMYQFASNLNGDGDISKLEDGQTIACNFMCIADMLAYADWVGLRPLSELEFEKMSRRPFPTLPLPGEYAWNTKVIERTTGIQKPGEADEAPIGGNANYGSVTTVGGPLRVGAFAVGAPKQQQAGTGFYGVMDMSGNLAEIYYNANTAGRAFNAFSNYSHGDGYLNKTTGVTDVANTYWPQTAPSTTFAVRGGSFADNEALLSISDRTRNMKYLDAVTTRKNDISFRLGYSAPQNNSLDVFLSLQNGRTSKQTGASDTICGYTTTYTISGNKPENIQGAYTFIWYILEDGGVWRILENQNDQSLTYKNFVNNLSRLKAYQFRRKMITPSGTAETGVVSVVVDQAADALLNSVRDTIDGFGRSKGGFYAASTVNSDFVWRWIYKGRALNLKPHASGPKYSHYVPLLEHFKRDDGTINYGDNVIHLERRTAGVGSCMTSVKINVYIRKNVPESYPSKTVRCGDYMVDARDSKVYPTTLIGSQCWMGENLNWTGAGTCYGNSQANCNVYGRMYTWYEANKQDLGNYQKQGICPDGWHLPTNAEWKTMIDYLRADQGKKLRPSKYWNYVNQDIIGTNSTKFSALPGGYFMNSSYANMGNYARWWTSNVSSWAYQYVVQAGHWQWSCSYHGSGWGTRPSGCGGNQWWVSPVYGTAYYYTGNFAELQYNSNGMPVPTSLGSGYNGYTVDRLYIRCVKN